MSVKLRLLVFFMLASILVTSVTALELPAGVQKLIAYQTGLATGLTFLAAFLAGIISFTSPCGVAVIPAFLAIVFKDKNQSKKLTAVFSCGLITAFAILGIIAGLVSNIFDQFKTSIAILSGFFLILFGILTLFNKSMGKTCTLPNTPRSSVGVYFLGVLFGLGWTPCIGAVLSSIFFLALNLGSVLKSTLFAITFALGVCTPLLLIAYYADKKKWQPIGKIVSITLFGKKHTTYLYNIIVGLLLLFVGIIMLFWQGTGFFMSEIPRVLPWNMELLVQWNHTLVTSPFVRSSLANLLGLLLMIGSITLLWYALVRKDTQNT